MKLIISQVKKVTFWGILMLFMNFIASCNKDEVSPSAIAEEEPLVPEIAPEDKLPLFTVNTSGTAIVDEPKIDAELTIIEADIVSFTSKIGIEFRGASSQFFPKKSYGLETRDANNEDLDVSILNMPEEEDWILYAPYSDKSLVRNILIYDLSRDMNRYASRSQFVELNVNGTFQGLYVFMEKLKRDSNRIAINKLKDDENTGEDLTGGYILKIDKTAGNNLGEGYNDLNSFTSVYAPPNATIGQEINFLYEEPDAEDITIEQKNYIANYMAEFEDALASDDFMDPVLGYAAYIDVDSFIDFFILNEVSNNVDGFRLSTFMYKDKKDKLKLGPIWDFNLAFGNADYCSGGETNVWAYKFNERCPEDFWQIPFWWNRLLQDPGFVLQLKDRWDVLRGGILASGSIEGKVDSYVSTLNTAGAIDANFGTWNILGTYVWPNNFVGNSHDEEINYLKNWINERLNWLDGAIGAL